MKTFWIILCVLLGLGILAAGYYLFFSETAKKKSLIKQYNAARLKRGIDPIDNYPDSILMAMTVPELEALLKGGPVIIN